MRVRGIGPEYSDLLEEAGVDSIRGLRNRNPGRLHEAFRETNASKMLVRRPPSGKQVAGWVTQAKALPPVVTH
jgi:hypothetical protein